MRGKGTFEGGCGESATEVANDPQQDLQSILPRQGQGVALPRRYT
jgi:hypothetical protein